MRIRMARDFIRMGIRTGTVVVGLLLGAGPIEAARRPNVVVIVTDDQGYADFGFQGSPYIRTPHIDELARAGVYLANGYVSHPYCSPTRAGLLTGRYQQRFGHETNPAFLPENEKIGLPVGEKTLADHLGRAGYATAAIGKWHLGAAPPFHPMKRGFDEFFGFLGGGHDYFEAEAESTEEYTMAIEHNGRPVELDDYLTDALSHRAVDFIRRHRKGPFFLYLAYNAPHTPYQAPARYLERFADLPEEKCRAYAAMISAVDDGVGRLVETLRELGIFEHTLIFFLSDNGGQTRYECADNSPLRGRKGRLYEGGVRVPFFAVWPGRLEAGKSFEPLVSSLDVFATAVEAAGAKASDETVRDGVDLMPYLEGAAEKFPRDTLYWRVGGGANWAVRRGRWKLVHQRPEPAPELFDLEADPGETKNLAREHPDTVRELSALYHAWSAKMIPPRWRDP